MPPHCRDDELTALFSESGPGANGSWAYYADGEGKTPINESQMAALGEIGILCTACSAGRSTCACALRVP